MQHIFEALIEKKPDSKDPEPISRIYVTESARYSKVAKLFKKEVLKLGIVNAAEIQNIYLHLLR